MAGRPMAHAARGVIVASAGVAEATEVGIDISQNVAAACTSANDRCPVTPPHVHRLHWGFEDPARATGTEEEIQAKFNEVRDKIRDRIQSFIQEEIL